MKKNLMMLIAALGMVTLASATTPVTVKVYPDNFAYNSGGGWSGLGGYVRTSCTNITASCNVSASYSWGVGYWNSNYHDANSWMGELVSKYGNGTRNAPKLGLTWSRIWPTYIGGMARVPDQWVCVADFGNESRRSRVCTHELGHLFRNDAVHCTEADCAISNEPSATYSEKYGPVCRGVINGRY